MKTLDGMDHISRVSACEFGDDDTLNVGDVFSVGAIYNSSDHMLMGAHHGSKSLEPIMGIARIYVV
jgi:hypothetical protein